MMQQKTTVIHSGGIDSTVLLAFLKFKEGHLVEAVQFNYGQRHVRELQSAARVCDKMGIDCQVIDISHLQQLFGASALTDRAAEVPTGEYTHESLRSTVVPNRNMIMLSIAAAAAIASGSQNLAYGAHADDHAVYPDCRPAFIEAMGTALGLCHFEPLNLLTPFASRTKGEIVALGLAFDAPLGLTWSCYKGGALHCGECSTCTARKEAFKSIRAEDPTQYRL